MARAYSDDLRRRVVGAWLSGKGSMRELSVRFEVSYGWVRKVAANHRRTGSAERPVQRSRGPVSRIDAELVRSLVRSKPDLVLRELQQELGSSGVSVSVAHLARVLGRLGLRLKKSRSMPPSGTVRAIAGDGKSTSPRSPRSRPRT